MISWVDVFNIYPAEIIERDLSGYSIFFAITFFYLSQSTPCGHNCIVITAWDLARGKPLRTPVWRLTS